MYKEKIKSTIRNSEKVEINKKIREIISELDKYQNFGGKTENNKIKKEINDIVNDNLKALEQLFPSAVKDGQLDIKALKEELGDFEEVGIERYELNWLGNRKQRKWHSRELEIKH